LHFRVFKKRGAWWSVVWIFRVWKGGRVWLVWTWKFAGCTDFDEGLFSSGEHVEMSNMDKWGSRERWGPGRTGEPCSVLWSRGSVGWEVSELLLFSKETGDLYFFT
jgi:hypothetical protein